MSAFWPNEEGVSDDLRRITVRVPDQLWWRGWMMPNPPGPKRPRFDRDRLAGFLSQDIGHPVEIRPGNSLVADIVFPDAAAAVLWKLANHTWELVS